MSQKKSGNKLQILALVLFLVGILLAALTLLQTTHLLPLAMDDFLVRSGIWPAHTIPTAAIFLLAGCILYSSVRSKNNNPIPTKKFVLMYVVITILVVLLAVVSTRYYLTTF